MNSLDTIFKQDIEIGKAALADYIKMALYQADEAIFERLYFENDAAFLEPLLIAYLSTGAPNYTTLEQILCSYFIEPEGCFLVKSDSKGVVYIARIGYFYTDLPNQNFQLCFDGKVYFLENTNFSFLPCLTIADGRIEIYRHEIPLLEPFYEGLDGDSIIKKPVIEPTQTSHRHSQSIDTSFQIIKTHLPSLYQEIISTNSSLSVFYNPLVNCFANIGVTGCAFLSAIPTNETIFFLEEIIHQCAHNTFNIMLFNRADYFKIDVENTQLSDLILIEGEQRSIYSAIHGLYTVAKRYEAFYELYKANVFSGIQKHEFMGRLADLKKRFRTGLELLNLDEIYTTKGRQVYETLDAKCAAITVELKHLEMLFDLSNQPSEFSYICFLERNPFEKFMAQMPVFP